MEQKSRIHFFPKQINCLKEALGFHSFFGSVIISIRDLCKEFDNKHFKLCEPGPSWIAYLVRALSRYKFMGSIPSQDTYNYQPMNAQISMVSLPLSLKSILKLQMYSSPRSVQPPLLFSAPCHLLQS